MFKKLIKGLCFCAACGQISHMEAECDNSNETTPVVAQASDTVNADEAATVEAEQA